MGKNMNKASSTHFSEIMLLLSQVAAALEQSFTPSLWRSWDREAETQVYTHLNVLSPGP